jgi:cobalt-zinc-cadmium efflux system outer membrane protein
MCVLVVSGCAFGSVEVRSDVWRPPPRAADGRSEVEDTPPAGPVSLEQLLAYADRHAPELSIAGAATLAGEAEIVAADPFFPDDPDLELGGGIRRTNAATVPTYGASIHQRLEIAGEHGLREEAAEAYRDSLNARYRATRAWLHQRIRASYGSAIVARERAALSARFRAFAEQLAAITDARAQAGEGSPIDVEIAAGELAQARQAELGAVSRYMQTRLRMAELSGWPAASPPEPQGSLVIGAPAIQVAQLLPMALQRRAELRAGALAERAAEARVELADREAWPDPTIGVAYEREGDSPNEPVDVITGSLSLPFPLFHANRPERARSRAALAQVQAENDALRRNLPARLQRTAEAVRSAAARVAVYGADVLPRFERSLEMLQRTWELGEIDLLRVTLARARLVEVSAEALAAYEDYYTAVAELEGEVGAPLPDMEGGEP